LLGHLRGGFQPGRESSANRCCNAATDGMNGKVTSPRLRPISAYRRRLNLAESNRAAADEHAGRVLAARLGGQDDRPPRRMTTGGDVAVPATNPVCVGLKGRENRRRRGRIAEYLLILAFIMHPWLTMQIAKNHSIYAHNRHREIADVRTICPLYVAVKGL